MTKSLHWFDDGHTAIDENELEIKFNDLIAKNIKKGWVKI